MNSGNVSGVCEERYHAVRYKVILGIGETLQTFMRGVKLLVLASAIALYINLFKLCYFMVDTLKGVKEFC